MRIALAVCGGLAACGGVATNEAVATHGRSTEFKAHVTRATFDGRDTTVELGPRIRVVIASCYAHAQQKIGDHDRVLIELDGVAATAGELDIADCSTKHVVARLTAELANGTHLEAVLDTDLARP